MRRVRYLIAKNRIAVFATHIYAAMALAGCAAPGPPTPPRSGIPKAVSDLTVRQQGTKVVLRFTLPKNSVSGDALNGEPDIDVYRGRAGVAGGKQPRQLVLTVPSAAVDNYLRGEKVEIIDALDEAAMQQRNDLVYVVRTRTTRKRASADSNFATLAVELAPRAPSDFRAKVTETAIEFVWTAPRADVSGAPLSAELSYNVYRGEVEGPAEENEDLGKAKLKVPLALIGSASGENYRDEQFKFGTNYVYTVRAATAQAGRGASDREQQLVESADSAPIYLTPKDIFPPARPTGLVAAIVPGTAEASAYVELSWEANGEADLAGYWVYRSEDSNTQGEKINSELLLSPTVRDTKVAAGKRYFYRVTAVDETGNESAASDAIAVNVPQE